MAGTRLDESGYGPGLVHPVDERKGEEFTGGVIELSGVGSWAYADGQSGILIPLMIDFLKLAFLIFSTLFFTSCYTRKWQQEPGNVQKVCPRGSEQEALAYHPENERFPG